MTLVQSLLNTCKKFPGKIAVTDRNGVITFNDLLHWALGYAAQVLSEDTGNHIGILLPNSKEFVATFYGILMAGKTPVPLNFLLAPPQLSYVIQDADINTIFTNNQLKSHLGNQIKHIFLVEEKNPYSPIEKTTIKQRDAEEPATLLYTSGTEANPKGVLLTHKNFLSNLEGCISVFQFTEKDMPLGILPLFHTYALTTTMVFTICVGASTVYLDRFSGHKVLELIERYKITSLFAIPSMYRIILRSAKSGKYDLSSLKLCASGGEHLPDELQETFNKVFPVPVMEGYGLTEATAIVSANYPGRFKPGSIGPPLRNLEVKIANDNGQSQPFNTIGEIWVKGPSVMKGYYKLPRETAETVTPDSWLKTGDYGILDEDGFLWITGRKKELIIISGENVSPTEIEHVISKNKKVFEVAVIGVPDKTRGEVPKAFIVLQENAACSEEEIKAYCMQKLPHYKVPKYIEFTDELPHGPTGKVLKRGLK
jgi:long-chain acyl-CoA synthetase